MISSYVQLLLTQIEHFLVSTRSAAKHNVKLIDDMSHNLEESFCNRTPIQDETMPLLSAAAPALIGMPSCPSLEPQFNGFTGLYFKSCKDKHDMLSLNFLLTRNETFGASGDERATQHHRSLPPLSASTTTSPEATAKLIVSYFKKDAPQAAMLTGCMIRSELTRQWINKHIKNTTSTSCDGGADVASSSIVIHKTKQGCAKTKTCPSPHRRVSSSKQYFRLRSTSKQPARKRDLKLAGAAGRRRLGESTTTTTAAEETSKYLAQATSYTKTFKTSGVLLRTPDPRKVRVSDYLRMTLRA
jgi:hypothetical protein